MASAEEFRDRLKQCGLKQVDLCRLVEVLTGEHLPEVTVNRWAMGKRAVPPLVMAWLALWQKLPEVERSTIRTQTTPVNY